MKEVKDMNVEEQQIYVYDVNENGLNKAVTQRAKELAEIYNQVGHFVENLRQDTEEDFNRVLATYVDLSAVINNIPVITKLAEYIKETKFNVVSDDIEDGSTTDLNDADAVLESE